MHCSCLNLVKVAVLGAAGGIGQPLSLLMKTNPHVTELRLYDIKGAPGVAADLSHIPTKAKVTGHGPEAVEQSLKGAELVLIPAGMPRKPGMTRDDLFSTNASIVRDLIVAVGKHAPKAMIGIITNPVNSTVPIAVETLKKMNVYDSKKVFGITTLDLIRARTFVGEALGKDPSSIDIPVIGGHSGETIIPVLSSCPALSEEQIKAITQRVQFGGDEVVKAKAGAGSATLSMAYAGAEWAEKVIRALKGEKGVIAYAFIESDIHPESTYFSSLLEFDENGWAKKLPLPKLSAFEEELLKKCIKDMGGNIKKGVTFASQ